MADVKQPQDRKAKATPYKFDHEGKSHALPLASIGAEKVPGKLTRDAIMDPGDETAQMRLGFALLEACGASEAALEALYSKSSGEMMAVLGEWMDHGDGQGTSAPKS